MLLLLDKIRHKPLLLPKNFCDIQSSFANGFSSSSEQNSQSWVSLVTLATSAPPPVPSAPTTVRTIHEDSESP